MVVIVVAALAAIIGDNVGYWLGRKGGRGLLARTPYRPRRYFERALPPAERFFARHGPKTVFIGRFVALLRVTSAWLAGISHMPWWRFLLWNALGGIVWATVVGARRIQVRRGRGRRDQQVRAVRRRSRSWSLIVIAFIGYRYLEEASARKHER